MDKKVVLITGCSSGIGLSLAVRLASDPDKAFKGNSSQHLPTIVLHCISQRAWTELATVLKRIQTSLRYYKDVLKLMEHFIGNITDTILREMLKIFLC